MKKKLVVLITSIAMTAGLAINAFAAENVTASGSTALLPIVKAAASEYMAKHTDVNITVAGGGSGTGLQQVTDGTVMIGDSDVFAADGSGLVDHQVCVEPFVFIVNQDVLVPNLTTAQIVGIFSGKITNWKEVGGKSESIKLIGRSPSSGTRMTIQKLIMGNDQFATNMVVQDSSKSVATTVLHTPGAIGYADLAYATNMTRVLKYNGVAPTIQNVKNGTYTVTAFGHMYTKGEATGAAKDFIQYIQSKDFQDRALPQYFYVSVNDIKKGNVKKVTNDTKPAKKK